DLQRHRHSSTRTFNVPADWHWIVAHGSSNTAGRQQMIGGCTETRFWEGRVLVNVRMKMERSLICHTIRLLGASLSALLICLAPMQAQAQNFSPYSDFQSMSLSQLATLQVKLTFVGPQREVIPTVVFTSSSNTLDLSLFVHFHRGNISYTNDGFQVNSFSATTLELQSVINNVATLPAVTAGGVDSVRYLSYSMVNTAGGTKGFEAVLNLSNASALLAQLRAALANNPTGLRQLADLAC